MSATLVFRSNLFSFVDWWDLAYSAGVSKGYQYEEQNFFGSLRRKRDHTSPCKEGVEKRKQPRKQTNCARYNKDLKFEHSHQWILTLSFRKYFNYQEENSDFLIFKSFLTHTLQYHLSKVHTFFKDLSAPYFSRISAHSFSPFKAAKCKDVCSKLIQKAKYFTHIKYFIHSRHEKIVWWVFVINSSSSYSQQ